MGHWVMHIEGHGIHHNGLEEDAEAMLARFAADLALHHHVRSVTFTTGSTCELTPASDDGAPLAPPPQRLPPGEPHAWYQH